MKKLMIFAAVAVFGITSMNAQVIFGAKAGVNLASINGDDTEGASGLTSFHVGAVARIEISEFFSVQPEVVYSAQGFSSEEFSDFKIKLDYLNIPIMADFVIMEGLSLQGGPQVGINISAKSDIDGVTEDLEDVETLDIAAGIGAQYRLAGNGLFFQARYVTGLTEIVKDFNQKNSVASVSVGYMFD